ncbi:MAG: C39 family peptidase [Coprobacillus sp.]
MKKKLIIIALIIIPMCIVALDYFVFAEHDEPVVVDSSYDTSDNWQYIQTHKDEYPTSLLELALRNKETIPFVAHYLDKKDKKTSMNISKELKSQTIPLFLQWDERWGYKDYGDDIMAINGCGPTCLSMVVSYLTKNPAYHPYKIAQFALENGYVVNSQTSWDLMREGVKSFGINVQELSLSEDLIIKNLEQGNPIICSMSKGIFTTTGHFIVLKEYKDGLIYVNDPNSQSLSQRGYTFKEIQYQIKNLWVYSL